MKEPLKQEIRRILRGYIDYDHEERLIAAERTERLRLLGLFNGAGAAGAFGVAMRKRRYTVTDRASFAMDDCRDAFARLGRSVALDSAPEFAAVFYSPILFNPSVMTAVMTGEVLEICVYTARTLTVRLNTAHAFRRWRQKMPDGLREKAAEEKKNGKGRKRRNTRSRQSSGIPAQEPPAGEAEPDAASDR